ncbi:MAG TPA: hypothetical protein VMS17_12725 [Gemmataceae bacterium]|nr:hypothetical protein [Gemmataceae bacterium]
MPLLVALIFASFLGEFNLQTIFVVASTCITVYFWVIKWNRERTGLKLYRVADFRADRLQCSDKPGQEKATWYGEIFLANPSTLPIAVVRFRVQLLWRGRWMDGRTVMERKDDMPWTVEPLRVLARSFGCAFDVEEGTAREQLLKPHKLRFTWTTVDGRQKSQDVETSQTASAALKVAA